MRGSGRWNRLWSYSVPHGQGRLLGTYEGLMQNRGFRGNLTRRTQPLPLGDRVLPPSPPRDNGRPLPTRTRNRPGGDTYTYSQAIRCRMSTVLTSLSSFTLCPLLINTLFNIYHSGPLGAYGRVGPTTYHHLPSHLSFSPFVFTINRQVVSPIYSTHGQGSFVSSHNTRRVSALHLSLLSY